MLTLPLILSVLDAAVVRPLPCHQVHGLSFYEFARHYQMKQAWHPLTAQAHEAHAEARAVRSQTDGRWHSEGF